MSTITLNVGCGTFRQNLFNKFVDMNSSSSSIGKVLTFSVIPHGSAYNIKKAKNGNDNYSIASPINYESERFLHMHADGKRKSNKELLIQISKLGEDWNGYGSTPFSSESISFFEQLIDNLNIQPIISPTGRDSLYLEYSDGKGMLGFEAFENKIEMAFISDEGTTFTKSIEKNFFEEMNKIVDKYYE